MPSTLEKFVAEFKAKNQFSEVKSVKNSSGSLIIKINLSPERVFELLEVLFGNYIDPHGDILFIDNKTNWGRYIVGKSGAFRIYEYRGSTSISSTDLNISTNLSGSYSEEAKELKIAIEEAWPLYVIAKAENLKEELAARPMANFTRAFLSTKVLLERSMKVGSLLETLVLNATLLDGILRLGIILSTQLRERNDYVNNDMIFQEGNKYISERKIYQMAKDDDILSNEEFKEISSLYDFRNGAIHRFFISGIEYREIKLIINRYEIVLARVRKTVNNLENLQIAEGVGMTRQDDIELSEEMVKQILREQYLKIDSTQPVAVVPKRNYLFDKDN